MEIAEDSELERKVALKFLPEALQSDASALARLRRAAKSAASLDHPYICKVYEVGETDDGRAFIAMEYVDGESLAAFGQIDERFCGAKMRCGGGSCGAW